jgi:elongation factor G
MREEAGMQSYSTEAIRNLGIVGHGGTGKTQLVSACLYTAGMTPRFGKVTEGSAVTDWDEEETARHFSIQTGTAYAEWSPHGGAERRRINFLDTPGYSAFLGDTHTSLIAADAVLILVDAAAGIQVGTETVWGYATEYDLPRAFLVNGVDRDLASVERVVHSLRDVFGRGVIPLQLPIGSDRQFHGLVDLISMTAESYTPDGDGKPTIGPIPPTLAAAARAGHDALVELVAESDDALMQQFFDEGTLPVDVLKRGLHEAIDARRVFPVLLGSALHNVGMADLLDFIAELCPSPAERGVVRGVRQASGELVERAVSDDEPLSLFVYKTVSDPYAGRVSYFKVLSGVLRNEATVQNFTRTATERFHHLQLMQGKAPVAVADLHAGDLGAVAKLRDTLTGDTLGEKNAPIVYPPPRLPEPLLTFAVEPKTRADEDRIGAAIQRILEADCAVRFRRDPQTKEFLLSGAGQQHIEVVVAMLRNRYHVALTLKPPRVPYQETIRGTGDGEGKHKKQTGGHGQFGICRVTVEALPRGSGLQFVDAIVGGAIPRNWIPSVEKGVREAAERGSLAGFPVVDLRVTLTDGKYHDVDSSDMAFKIAGSLAFKEAMKHARPALLEPIMMVQIQAPDSYSGSLMGDLSGRRGRISGSDARGHAVIIKALVPLAEMLSYANDLVSMTQGRGSYSMALSHYDIVPADIAEKVVARHKPHRVGADEGAAVGA